MTYRANKIRQATNIQRELDPDPYICGEFDDLRHGYFTTSCPGQTFSPRPGYERDRSKYE